MTSAFDIRGLLNVGNAGFIRGMEEGRAELRRFQNEQRRTGASSRVLATQTRDLNNALDDQANSLRGLTLQFTSARNAMRTLGLRLVISGLDATLSSVMSLVGGLGMLAQGAGEAALALGTVGLSSVLALAQGYGVLKLAMGGVMKALTTQGTAHEKALAKLTAPARAFVGELRNMQKAFQDIKRLAQVGLFPGLVDGLKAMAPLLKPIKQIVYDTATTIGYLGDQLGHLLGDRAPQISTIFSRQIVVLRRLGETAINFGKVFLDAFDAAWPLIGRVTRDLVTFSGKLADMADHGGSKLSGFFTQLRQHYDNWKVIIGGLGATIYNVVRAAEPVVQELEKLLGGLFQKWADWTGSLSGQHQIRDFFESQMGPLKAMGKLIGDLAAAMAQLSEHGQKNAIKFWDMLDQKVLPLLKDLGDQLNNGFFPAFVDLIGSLAGLLDAALPGLKLFGKAMHLLMETMSNILDIGTKLVQQQSGINKLLTAFAVGAVVLGSWAKLRTAISLAILGLGRVLGLSKEIAVLKPGLALLTSRGGKLTPGLESTAATASGVAAAAGVGGGVGGSGLGSAAAMGAIFGTMGIGATGFPAEATAAKKAALDSLKRRLQLEEDAYAKQLNTQLANERDQVAGAGVGRVSPIYQGPINPLTGKYQNPDRLVYDANGRVVSGTGKLNTPARTSVTPGGSVRYVDPITGKTVGDGRFGGKVTTAPGARTTAYRTPIDDRPTGGRIASTARQISNMSAATAQGVGQGISSAIRKSAPVLKAGFAFSAAEGIVAGVTSSANTFGGKVNDALSGATMGIIKSTATKQEEFASKVAKIFSEGGTLKGIPNFKEAGKTPSQILSEAKGKDVTITKADLANPTRVAALKVYVDNLRDLGKVSDADRDSLNKMLDGMADRISHLGPSLAKLKGAMDSTLDLGSNPNISGTLDTVTALQAKFDELANSTSFARLATNVQHNVAFINRQLGKGTLSGQMALRKTFTDAAAAVKAQMDAAGKTTKEGTTLINHYLTKALMAVNPSWTHAEAVAFRGGKIAPQAGVTPVVTPGNARGALHRVPGGVGPDSVPMSLNGTNAIVAPGEDIAVITRHQRAKLDTLTAGWGGLAGFMQSNRTPHNAPVKAATGGFFPASGTNYSVGDEPVIAADLDRLGRALGLHLTGISGYRTPAHSVEVGGFANDPHTRGAASDTPGIEGVAEAILEKYGLTRPFGGAAEADHIQLLGSKGGGVLAAMINGVAGAATTAAKSVADITLPSLSALINGDADGLPAQLVNESLAQVAAAAQAMLSSSPGAAGGFRSTGSTGGSAEAKAYARSRLADYGWDDAQWSPLDSLWNGESGWDPNAVNKSSGASGIPQALGHGHVFDLGDFKAQVDWGMNYIKSTYGTPDKAYAAWLARSPHWYSEGGILEAATSALLGSSPPPRNQGTPNVPSDVPLGSQGNRDARGHIKKKKTKAQKKPYTSGHPMPDISKIHATAKKHGAAWLSKYHKFELSPEGQGVDPGLITDFDAKFNTPIAHVISMINNAVATAALSDEQPLVTLMDTREHQDLTNFWKEHPGAFPEYTNADGTPAVDSWDVVNWDGMTVQGEQVRGIRDHVSELINQLMLHTGSDDGSGSGGLLGMYEAELTEMGLSGKRAGIADRLSHEYLADLKKAWEFEHVRHEFAADKVRTLSKGGQSWEDRVATNKAGIKALEDWKRSAADDKIGHRASPDLQHKIAKANQEIADLRNENTTLETDKPGPKTTVPKGASAAQRKRINDANAARTKSLGHWTAIRTDSANELDFIDGSREVWTPKGGAAGGWSSRIDALDGAIAEITAGATAMTDDTLPQERISIIGIQQERALWDRTSAPLPPLPDLTASTSNIDALLREQNENLAHALAVSQGQYSALAGFQPLVAARLAGAFAHGGVIPETGAYLMHKNERVVTDPDGAFRTNPNSLAAMMSSHTGGGDVHVHVDMDSDLSPLVSRVDARVERAQRDQGRRQRRFSGAPGGRK